MNLVGLFIKSGRFGLLTLISKLIAVPKEIIVAGILNPEAYGIIGIVVLWQSYTGFVSLGIGSAASREVPYLVGGGETDKATKIQNVGITSDLPTRTIPFLILLIAAFLYEDLVFRIGLMLAAITVVVAGFSGNIDNMSFVKQQYNLVFRGRFINEISKAVIVLLLIFSLQIYAVFIATTLSAIITLLFYLKYNKIDFKFEFDWSETRRLIKPGIAFALLALIYNSFRLVDRTVGAYYLSLSDLGMYVFAFNFAFFGIAFLKQSISALSPTLYEEAGKEKDIYVVFSGLARMAIYWSLLAAMMIPFAQMVFYLMVNLIVTKYSQSIPIFYVLSLSFFLVTTYSFANTILVSPMVNRQNISVVLNLVALIMNAILNVAAIKMGYGMLGIAWGTIISQGMIMVIFFFFCKGYMFKKLQEFVSFLFKILVPLFVAISFIFVNLYLDSVYFAHWKVVFISFCLQLIVWMIFIFGFYRSYFPIRKWLLRVSEQKS